MFSFLKIGNNSSPFTCFSFCCQEDDDSDNSRPVSLTAGPNEYLVKYFGSVPVNIGTGIETVENAVQVDGERSHFYLIFIVKCFYKILLT